MIEGLASRAPRRPVLLSNSSSILPAQIHADCVGLHLFYPVETTGIAELVMPEHEPVGAREAVRRIAEACALELIVQNESRAFAANRLLLPMQAEACRNVMAGCEPAVVDSATQSSMLAIGVLALMDSVGLDVVLPAARNYVSRMTALQAEAHAPLVQCLEVMVRGGKLGNKNKDGFLVGQPAPWTASQAQTRSAQAFRLLMMNACASALDDGLLDARELALVLSSLYGSTETLDDASSAADVAQAGRLLGELYLETGLCYFRPASRFQVSNR
jgi:3-hydroxyacyl-CoA dehydrogenase